MLVLWKESQDKLRILKKAEAKKEFDEWKEKERAKLYGEIDKLKKLFWDEFVEYFGNLIMKVMNEALPTYNKGTTSVHWGAGSRLSRWKTMTPGPCLTQYTKN